MKRPVVVWGAGGHNGACGASVSRPGDREVAGTCGGRGAPSPGRPSPGRPSTSWSGGTAGRYGETRAAGELDQDGARRSSSPAVLRWPGRRAVPPLHEVEGRFGEGRLGEGAPRPSHSSTSRSSGCETDGPHARDRNVAASVSHRVEFLAVLQVLSKSRRHGYLRWPKTMVSGWTVRPKASLFPAVSASRNSKSNPWTADLQDRLLVSRYWQRSHARAHSSHVCKT